VGKADDVIFWIDLETSGSRYDKDVILEAGAAVTTHTPELKVLGTKSVLVMPDDLQGVESQMNAVVAEMHNTNGLLDDLWLSGKAVPVSEADRQLVAFLREFIGGSNQHVALAGSGVMHFDRNFIRKYMPKLDKRLTYWAYDVGAVRRSMRLFGYTPNVPEDYQVKAHRGLDDVLLHIKEMRNYANYIGSTLPGQMMAAEAKAA
jgi:oligoribonuclease